jgi:hypothetical protein
MLPYFLTKAGREEVANAKECLFKQKGSKEFA